MNKLFYILLFVTNLAYSQQKSNKTTWHLTVIDSITNNGIANANISVNGTKKFSSNVNGVVNIDDFFIKLRDLIYVTCVGYKTLSFSLATYNKFPDSLKLVPTVRLLKEIKISGSNDELKIGEIKKSYNSHRIPNASESFCQFIPNEKKIKGIITSVEFVMHNELQGIEEPFILRLYSKTKGSLKPNISLINDSIIIRNLKKVKLLSVDISKYQIQFPDDGVIIIFETLPSSSYKKDMIFYKERNHFKMPGLDMSLKKKDEYLVDYDKLDRQDSYAMVGPPVNRQNLDDIWHEWYVFPEGNNFAISLTIDPHTQ